MLLVSCSENVNDNDSRFSQVSSFKLSIMHVGDALVSPPVAAVMGVISIAFLAVAAKKIRESNCEQIAPLMGVTGAFIFACQMINFTIPGTGSSGHIVGGILLASVLGPWAAFITLSSVLVIQSLFFADGGLLALGCNLFNMGVCTCLIAYPLIFHPIVKQTLSFTRILWASILSCVVGLELGAVMVTVETEFSGLTALPIGDFLLFMLPIHAVIGAIEGIATGAVIWFLFRYRPDLLDSYREQTLRTLHPQRRTLFLFIVLAFITGGIVSWFASEHPDGLEWSLEKMQHQEVSEVQTDRSHQMAEKIQQQTAILPDYGFREQPEKEREWGEANAGTSFAGIAGGIIILGIAIGIGTILKHRKSR